MHIALKLKKVLLLQDSLCILKEKKGAIELESHLVTWVVLMLQLHTSSCKFVHALRVTLESQSSLYAF